jgi:hypothetical protein
MYLPRQESLSALVRVEGGWGEGYPSPQPLALYYRVKTHLPELVLAYAPPWDEDFYNILRFGLPAPRHFYAFPSYFGSHEDFTISRPPIEPRPARGRRGGPWSFAQRLFRRCAKLIRIVAVGPRLAAQIWRRNRRGRPCLKIGTARARHLSSPATKSLLGGRGPPSAPAGRLSCGTT